LARDQLAVSNSRKEWILVSTDKDVKAQATGRDGDKPSTSGIIECGRPELSESIGSKIWSFADGNWQELPADCLDGNADLERDGYDVDCDDFESPVAILPAEKKSDTTRRWRFVVWLNLGGVAGYDAVFVRDLADLLTLAPQLAAYVELFSRKESSRSSRQSQCEVAT
jgi:hypothetical protein